MPMLFFFLRRAFSYTAALAILLAMSGCASKNPLIDEPAAKPAPQAESAPDKPVLPKPVLVIKPGESVQHAPSTPSAPASQSKIIPVEDMNKPAPTGASRWLGIFTPYRINIQQGNFISQDMAAKLRPGMTKEQVRFVLGTPLLTDMFHSDRWDYLFRLQKPNGEITANRVAVFFRDNRVERIDSSELPSESEYLSHIVGPAGPVAPAKPVTPPAKPAAPSPQPSIQP